MLSFEALLLQFQKQGFWKSMWVDTEKLSQGFGIMAGEAIRAIPGLEKVGHALEQVYVNQRKATLAGEGDNSYDKIREALEKQIKLLTDAEEKAEYGERFRRTKLPRGLHVGLTD